MGATHAQRSALGRYGEDVAVAHLEAAGLQVLERNWRCPHGEVDVVADDAGTVVVCEVKTRRDTAHGTPLEAITPQKAARLRRLAVAWLAEHPEAVGPAGVRIDVVAVVVPRRGRAHVERLSGVC